AARTWMPAAGRSAFHEAAVRTAFRSSQLNEGWVYLANAGAQRVTDTAPLALWPGAGEGRARDPLLRAHPLLDGGVIDLTTRTVFGKTLVDAHAEAQRWFASAVPIPIGIAVFGDVARASRMRANTSGSLAQLDLGTGARVRIP